MSKVSEVSNISKVAGVSEMSNNPIVLNCLNNLISLIMSEVVKSGSSPGQSLDEFQIKGARTGEQRLA